MSKLARRLLVAALAAGATVTVVALVVEPSGPDYDAIQTCRLPSVVPDPEVEVVAAPLTGVELQTVADIPRGTAVVGWPDGERLAVANRDGGVWLVSSAGGEPTQILDLSDRIVLNAEGGIVGMALAPDGEHLYTHHTDREGVSHVLEYATTDDGIDEATERQLLELPHPALVHNGGAMAFGADGDLYLGFGDGGGRPQDAARVADLGELDGKLLRIDPAPSGDDAYSVPADNPLVDDEDARGEVWLTGLRNPYRFSIDPVSGDIWVGDVGEACYEEISVVDADQGGADLGFPRFEGTHEFLGGEVAGTVFPVYTYSHEDGCAVIAGEVVRDPALPMLAGRFVFSDYCAGGISWLERGADGVAKGTLDVAIEGVQSFGVGGGGEVYVLTATSVLQLVPS